MIKLIDSVGIFKFSCAMFFSALDSNWKELSNCWMPTVCTTKMIVPEIVDSVYTLSKSKEVKSPFVMSMSAM